MSLYDFIYNLQNKSDKVKKIVLALLLIISFIILSIFWVFMFKRQISKVNTYSNLENETETVGGTQKNIIAPLAAIFEGMKGLKSDISEKIEEIIQPEKNIRQVYELPSVE